MRRSQYIGIGLLVAVVACVALAMSAWVSLHRERGDPQSMTLEAERTDWIKLFTRTPESTWTVSTLAFANTWTPLVTQNISTPSATPCPKGKPCPTATPFASPTLPVLATFEPSWTQKPP